MAGNYADVPSWRFAYDRDGTQVYIDNVQQSSGDIQLMNNETTTAISTGRHPEVPHVFIFPELRDVDGYFIASDAGAYGIATSVNTTNGIDGTWVAAPTATFAAGWTSTAYRTNIASATILAVKAIRFYLNNNGLFNSAGYLHACHLYGEIAPDVNPNRLILWHPTLDQHVDPAHFDWGDVPRSSSADQTFRVKNNSATLTANNVRVAMDILTDTTPSVVGQHTLMKASVPASFLAQVYVGDLAPGAISEIVTLRRVTPANAVLSLWCHRVYAEATTWS